MTKRDAASLAGRIVQPSEIPADKPDEYSDREFKDLEKIINMTPAKRGTLNYLLAIRHLREDVETGRNAIQALQRKMDEERSAAALVTVRLAKPSVTHRHLRGTVGFASILTTVGGFIAGATDMMPPGLKDRGFWIGTSVFVISLGFIFWELVRDEPDTP